MAEPLMAGVRFALYADLMLAMGLSAFLLYGVRPVERADPAVVGTIRRSLLVLGALALPLSFAWMLALAARMFGVAIPALDRSMLAPIVLETSVGTAWLVQVASLAVSTCAAVLLGRQPTLAATIITLAGSIALGTLSWSGHAAVGEGGTGSLNRAADAIHMIAAGLWLGAIAALFLLIRSANSEAGSVAARELPRFSLTGTAFVAILAATGLLNVWMITAIGDPLRWPPGPYGTILAMKLGVFTFMLGLAALHRWKLVPRLTGPTSDADTLRRSLALEFAAGLAILAAVAVLGLLEP
jgi:putative copper resistance protein D